MEKKNQEQVDFIWKPLCLAFAALLVLSWVFFGVLCGKGGVDFSSFGKPEQNHSIHGGAVVGESMGNGIKLMSTKIAQEDYAANGISPMADTAYTITATVVPANAINKTLDWSVAFKNSSSSWATGKTVTDYVTITPTTDGAVTATVECKKAFGESILVTATSRANPDVSATAICDYVKRVESLSATFSASALKWQTEYTVSIEPVYGVGTLDSELIISGGNFALTEEFKSAVEAKMQSNYVSMLTYFEQARYEFNAQTSIFEIMDMNPFLTFAKANADRLTQMKVRDNFNNAFALAAGEYQDTHATFTLEYSCTYQEDVYCSGKTSINLIFDAESLIITVADVTLNNDHFIF